MRIRVFGVIKHTYPVSHDTHANLRARKLRRSWAKYLMLWRNSLLDVAPASSEHGVHMPRYGVY